MKKLLFFLLLLTAFNLLSAQTFTLMPESCKVKWTGSAAFSAYSLSGSLEVESGSFIFAEHRIGQAAIVFDMRSMDSEIDQLTRHLRSDDFFGVKKWRWAEFRQIGIAELTDAFIEVKGSLQLKGKTNEQTIIIKSFVQKGDRILLTGIATVDRTVYGIFYNSPNYFDGLKQDAIADEFVLEFELAFERRE